MTEDTPATEIREKDLAANCVALEQCLERMPPVDIRRILDIRYGLGGWAKVVLDKYPKATITAYEHCQEAADLAWKDRRVKLHVKKFVAKDDLKPTDNYDLLLGDINGLTIKNTHNLDDVLEVISPNYLVITDSCCSKLHINYKTYGLATPSLEQYWKLYKIEGYKFKFFSRSHFHASSALFIKKDAQIDRRPN